MTKVRLRKRRRPTRGPMNLRKAAERRWREYMGNLMAELVLKHLQGPVL